VRTSAGGAVTETCTNLPFGDGQSCSGSDVSPLHFTGKQRDPETNLDEFPARYYASMQGRWMTPDWSARQEAVPYADIHDPQSLNLYRYAANNPASHFDSDGHISFLGGILEWMELLNPKKSSGGTEQNEQQSLPWWQRLTTAISTAYAGAVKTYQTYTKANPDTGKTYSGRTSGTGTPEQNVASRDRGHHMNEEGYGPAQVDKSSTNPDAIRGREQQLIEANRGAQSQGGTSGNAINGISDTNPNKQNYMGAAESEFGTVPTQYENPIVEQDYLNNAAAAGGVCGMSGDSPCD
jgi:RHS repeat-associated protein